MKYYLNKKLETISNAIFMVILVIISYSWILNKPRPLYLYIALMAIIVFRLIYGIFIIKKSKDVLKNIVFIFDYLIFPIFIILMVGLNFLIM